MYADSPLKRLQQLKDSGSDSDPQSPVKSFKQLTRECCSDSDVESSLRYVHTLRLSYVHVSSNLNRNIVKERNIEACDVVAER